MARATKTVKEERQNLVDEMAEKKDIKRNDLFSINPFKVRMNEEDRGRFLPISDEKIVEMAISFHQNGQRSPVECRKKSKDEYILTFGFTRGAAARLLVDGFNHPETGEFIQNPKFMLKAVISDTNAEKALIHNIVENQHRNETTPMDDASNHHKLRENYGYTDAKISSIYRYSDPSKVARYRRLLHLPTEIQVLVHEKIVPVSAALEILDIDDDNIQKEMFQKMLDDVSKDVKVKASSIRQQVRERILNDDSIQEVEYVDVDGNENPDKKKEKSKTKPLTIREVRIFYETLKEQVTNESIQKFVDIHLKFLNGRCGEKRLRAEIESLADSKMK